MNDFPTTEINSKQCACIGNTALLQERRIALYCSRKCPAIKILDAVELFKKWAQDKQMGELWLRHSKLCYCNDLTFFYSPFPVLEADFMPETGV